MKNPFSCHQSCKYFRGYPHFSCYQQIAAKQELRAHIDILGVNVGLVEHLLKLNHEEIDGLVVALDRQNRVHNNLGQGLLWYEL